MATLQEQLSALINTPDKARKIKSYLDSVDPNTLSADDRDGYYSAHEALSRWVNPSPSTPAASVYTTPRGPNDALSRLEVRGPMRTGPITDTDPTLGEHLGQVPRGLADLAGIPTSGAEWKAQYTTAEGLLSQYPVVGPQLASAYRAFKGTAPTTSDIPIVGPMLIDPAKKINAPGAAYRSGRAPTREESLEATRAGASTIGALALTPKSVRQANVRGNVVVNPVTAETGITVGPIRLTKGAIKRAETITAKNVDKVRRKYPTETAERAREGADVAEALAADIQPTVQAMSPGQARARTAMRMSDAAVDTSKASVKMAKSEKAFEKSAPDQINRRLFMVVDDLETRLARGDNPGQEALARYRKSGIPENPDFVKADKVKVYEKTQAQLSQPEFARIAAPEDVVINAIAKEPLKKAHAPVGDSPSVNKHLRDIVERTRANDKLDMADYEVLRDMAEGTYQVGTNKKTGAPVYGRVEMPQILADTVGYIERLRRQHNGRLPSTPAELNAAKAKRYDDVPDRTFEGDLTEAEKSMNSVRRGQAMGLRRLVDEMTADASGKSQIAELNRQYANLSALETGVRNYDLANRLASPLPPMAMAGGGSASTSGLLRAATGTGVIATITRPIRGALVSPEAGRKFAIASERLASMRGLKRPPAKPGAGPPVGPTFTATPPSATPRPAPKTGPPSGQAPAAPTAAAPPKSANTDVLAKQAFQYARSGKLKKLEALWKEDGAELRKTMRPSDVAWIEDKLAQKTAGAKKRLEQRKAETPPAASAGPTAPPKPAVPKPTKPKPPAASAPTASTASVPNLDPLGVDRIKGDWRNAKSAEAVKPVVTERAIRPVDVGKMDADTLTAKVAEWETGRANAVKINDPKRVAWYDKKLAEARAQQSPAASAAPPPASAERRNPNAEQQSMMDSVRTDVDKAVQIMNGAGLKVPKSLSDIAERAPSRDVLDLFTDTDAELAAIESAGPPVARTKVQSMIDRAAELQKAGKTKQAEKLLDEALKLAEDLEPK